VDSEAAAVEGFAAAALGAAEAPSVDDADAGLASGADWASTV
jgi:hypothetical protein